MRLTKRFGGVVNGWLVRWHWVLLGAVICGAIYCAVIWLFGESRTATITSGVLFFIFFVWTVFVGTWRGEGKGNPFLMLGVVLPWGLAWYISVYRFPVSDPVSASARLILLLIVLGLASKLLNVWSSYRFLKTASVAKNRWCPDCGTLLDYGGEKLTGYSDRIGRGGSGTRTAGYASAWVCLSCRYEEF